MWNSLLADLANNFASKDLPYNCLILRYDSKNTNQYITLCKVHCWPHTLGCIIMEEEENAKELGKCCIKCVTFQPHTFLYT